MWASRSIATAHTKLYNLLMKTADGVNPAINLNEQIELAETMDCNFVVTK